MKRYDVLIIDPGTIEGRIEIPSVRKVFELLDLLPLEYALKLHPNMNKRSNLYDGLFQDVSEFPRYIPIELYFQFIKNCVIASMSVSLVTASKFDDINAVSTLECVDWCNQAYKDEIKDWLVKEADGKILFPSNLNELKEIIT